jgi:WD40 repeat protein
MMLSRADLKWSGSVWDAETGQRRLGLDGDSTAVTYAFSPEGKCLAIGQADGTVRLWSLERREELFGWQAWDERPLSPFMQPYLNFTADGSALAVADPSSKKLKMLDLTQIRSDLANLGLDW